MNAGNKRHTDQDTNDDRVEFIEVGPNVVRTTGTGEERLENPIEISAAPTAAAGTSSLGHSKRAKLPQPKDLHFGADSGTSRHNQSRAAAWSNGDAQVESQQRYSGADKWRPSELPQQSHARSVAPTRSAPLLSSESNEEPDLLAKAYLDTGSMVTDVTAHIGSKAYLVCRLRMSKAPQLLAPSSSNQQHLPTIGFDNNYNNYHQQQEQLQVSWVRDMQILTSGTSRYTSDDRFKPQHLANAREWALEIDGVRSSDAGTYDCQVNSEPKSARLSFRLNVISASLRLHEGDKVRANDGDRIRLTCEVRFARTEAASAVPDFEAVESGSEVNETEQAAPAALGSMEDADPVVRTRRQVNPNANNAGRWLGAHLQQQAQHYIYWYKDGISLGYNVPYGRVRVEPSGSGNSVPDNYQGTGDKAPIGNLLSVLTIDGASTDDTAIYSCSLVPELAEVRPAQVYVLVGSGGRYESDSSSVNTGLYIGTSGGGGSVFGECSAKHFMLIAITSATTSILLLIKFA